jgi:hypothetical protein
MHATSGGVCLLPLQTAWTTTRSGTHLATSGQRQLSKKVFTSNFLDIRRYCESNPIQAFASCSFPQELTNEEIDQGDSEVSFKRG